MLQFCNILPQNAPKYPYMRPFCVESGPRWGARSRFPHMRGHSKQKSGLGARENEEIFSRNGKKFLKYAPGMAGPSSGDPKPQLGGLYAPCSR